MRRDHPPSWASTLCDFTIPAWLPPAVLLFFLTLVSTVAESAAVTPADIEQLFKDKQFIQALPVLETWRQTLPEGLMERDRLLLLGRCLLGLERHSEAVETLRAMQAITPVARQGHSCAFTTVWSRHCQRFGGGKNGRF